MRTRSSARATSNRRPLTTRSPNDGLKIKLLERESGKSLVLAVDSVLDIALMRVLEQYTRHSQHRLRMAFKFFKTCLYTVLDQRPLDPAFTKACIKNVLVAKDNSALLESEETRMDRPAK